MIIVLRLQSHRQVRSRLAWLSAAGNRDSRPQAIWKPTASTRIYPCGS